MIIAGLFVKKLEKHLLLKDEIKDTGLDYSSPHP